MRIWKFPDQVVRLFILFSLVATAVIAVRQRFIPEDFGEEGHYRTGAVAAAQALEVRYAGTPVCLECHDDLAEVKAASYHRGLACEACHGPAAAHTEAPDEMTPVKPTSREACLACHSYLPSRPTGFPQVVPASHNANEPCISCHDPHDPTPPETPTTCGACHATVARTKFVSHHAGLECTTCHETPEAHWTDPRTALPRKPTERAFCGQCHGEEADSPSHIPRVDLAAHGDRYLCWQCHYPHHPEGG